MAGGVGLGDLFNPEDLIDVNKYIGNLPGWLNDIIDKIKEVAKVGATILGGLALLKLLDMAGILGAILSPLKNIITKLGTLKTLIFGLGLYAVIMGVITALKGLEAFLKEPTWDNFRQIIIGITIAAGGLIAVFIAMANPVGAAIAAVVGAIGVLVTVIGDVISGGYRLMTEEELQAKREKELIKIEERLKGIREELTSATDKYVEAVDRAEETARNLKEAQDRTKLSGEELYKAVQDGTLDYKQMNDMQKEVYKAYLDNQNAQENLITVTDEFNGMKEEEMKYIAREISKLGEVSKSYDDYKERVVKAYNEGRLSADQASIVIMHAMRDMDEETRKTFTQDLPNDIKNGLNPSKYNSWANSFKSWWNGNVMGGLNTKINLSMPKNFSSLVSKLGFSTGGLVRYAKGGLVTKMATGGLINLPGRGVPLASAIGGEAGKEGIVPLTDTQAMAELGREIGRWINVNATVINNMNGRQISRELQRLENEQDFAFNS